MATTEIHAITTTPNKAINYIMANKIVPYISEDEIYKDCPYELYDENGEKYVSYITFISTCNGCSFSNPQKKMEEYRKKFEPKRNAETRSLSGKEPLLWHCHQSFSGREVSPQVANQIGVRLAEEVFKGFPCVVTTHTNGENIHNHFIFSAWNKEGKKWHNCNDNYRLIRNTSDRLCEEYGLSVLENTRDVKLVKYKDENGITRFYEPTDRKNKLIDEREKEQISTGDVNDYRNTKQYKAIKKNPTRTIVKRDIDELWPSCRCFEDLISCLRQRGYEINDKKVNGDWLAHISYKPPGCEKAVRDSSIGDGYCYRRLNLSGMIEDQNRRTPHREELLGDQIQITDERSSEDAEDKQEENNRQELSYFEAYDYETVDLSKINDDFRKDMTSSGSFITVPRTENEKRVISDIRKTDDELKGMLDTSHLRQLIQVQNARKKQKKPYLNEKKEEQLVARVQQSFQCLRYTEKYGLYSYGQMLDLYKENRNKFREISELREKAANLLAQMQRVEKVPGIVEKLKNRISQNEFDEIYQMDQMRDDLDLLKKYKEIVQKNGLTTKEGQLKFSAKIADYTQRLANVELAIQAAAEHMEELENCIRVYDRLDRQRGISNAAFMARFENIVAGYDDQQPDQAAEAVKEEPQREEKHYRYDDRDRD